MDSNPNALPPGLEIGGYRLVRVLGEGGFGITYEAVSPVTGRRVAIKEFFPRGFASRENATKLLYSRSDGEIINWALDRFERSTNTLCELDHPNIIKVIHYIKEHDTGYMIMEYLEGPTLEAWLSGRERPPTPAELSEIFEKIFDALEYAHAHNVVHRDIAPDNIVIQPDGRPVLIDFGALKVIDPRTKVLGASFVIRKQHYAAPEQSLVGTDVKPATDIYSLAAVLYRALAGSAPTDSEERKDSIAYGRPDPYMPIGAVAKGNLSRSMAGAIDRALSFHAVDRQQTVRAFRESLDWQEARNVATQASRPRPPPAPPTGSPPSFRKVAAGLVAAVVAAGVAGTAWFDPLGWWRTGGGACAVEGLAVAVERGNAGLDEFLTNCPSGPVAEDARRRQIDIREQALVRDAGFDPDKLRAYLATCTRCNSRPEVEARLALLREEEAAYRAAANAIDRLEAYAKQCRACQYRDEALRTAEALRKELEVAKADEAAYRAAKGSPDRLDLYAKTCSVCRYRAEALSEAESLRRAQAEAARAKAEAERAKIDEAEYQTARGSIERLEAYARSCTLCRYRDDALREAKVLRQAQIDRARADEAAYNAAKGSIERLEAYARSCDPCRYREDALREAKVLRQAQIDRERADETAYAAARGSIERLENYLKTCVPCRFRSEAQDEIASLREARRRNEEVARQVAQQCIDQSRQCNPQHCLQDYAQNFPGSLHLSDLRTKAAACALPDGTYRAVRGYRSPRGTECRAHYDINAVNVRNGSISFQSDDYDWQGIADQRIGQINIPNQGIRHVRTRESSRHGLSVTGNYGNATVNSGLCGTGFFRILRPSGP